MTARLYVLASCLSLASAVISRRSGAVTLIVAYFFAVFVAIPALVQVERGQFPFGSSYTAGELNGGYLLLAVGQLSLILGMAMSGRESSRKGPANLRSTGDTPPDDLTRMGHDRVIATALIFAVIAVGLAALAGPSRIFTARFDDESTLAVEGLGAQLILIARAFALIGLLLNVVSLRAGPRLGSKKGLAALVVTVPVALVVNFPPALPRFQFLGVGLAIAVMLFDFYRPVIKIVFSIVATFFLLYLFAAVKDLRAGIALQDLAKRDVGSYLATVDFDGFKQVVDTVIYFSSASLRWGENFVGALLFWVPRAAWPDKPVHTGEIVSAGLGYPYNNVSNPLPAEAFASWGIFGTVGVMCLAGYMIARLERAARVTGGSARSIATTVAYAIAAGYATILMRGALNAVAPMILSAFVLTAALFIIYRPPRPHRARSRAMRAV